MALYEHTLIARQDISSQAVDQLAEDFAGIITANGGSVTKTENWGLRTLAYRFARRLNIPDSHEAHILFGSCTGQILVDASEALTAQAC